MAHHRSGRSGGGGLAGLLIFAAIYLFTDTKSYQNSVSGLGVAGATFFTLGLMTLGGAFLFADPITFLILASVGGGTMGLGVLLGVVNAISDTVKENREHRAKFSQHASYKDGTQSEPLNDLRYGGQNPYSVYGQGSGAYSSKSANSTKSYQGARRANTGVGPDPRLFTQQQSTIYTPPYNPEVYFQPTAPTAPPGVDLFN